MPERIQLSRKKGWRKPEGAIVVSRPSRWGNPFKVGETYCFVDVHGERVWGVSVSRDSAAQLFDRYLTARVDLHQQIREELGGRDLCCWCALGQACHADFLLRIANQVVADA